MDKYEPPTVENYYTTEADFIDIKLKEIILAIWQGKVFILLVTLVFSLLSISVALYLPNTYKSEIVLLPANQGSQSGLASMAAQFGGLASLAGISIGGKEADETAIALATLRSRKFITEFISKHELLIPLMATKGWDIETNEILLDEDIYDSSTKEWVRDARFPKVSKPTYLEAYEIFKKDILTISESKDTGIVTIGVTFYSPYVAKEWASLLVYDLNSWMKQGSLEESRRNIKYLEKQLELTSISEMRAVFYQLIEEQTKQLMLAEVESEFSFKTIDPAFLPEEKDGPKRALICIVGFLVGISLSILIVLVRFRYKQN